MQATKPTAMLAFVLSGCCPRLQLLLLLLQVEAGRAVAEATMVAKKCQARVLRRLVVVHQAYTPQPRRPIRVHLLHRPTSLLLPAPQRHLWRQPTQKPPRKAERPLSVHLASRTVWKRHRRQSSPSQRHPPQR